MHMSNIGEKHGHNYEKNRICPKIENYEDVKSIFSCICPNGVKKLAMQFLIENKRGCDIPAGGI